MTLEVLSGTTEIGGFGVVVMDELRKQYPEKFTETGAMDHKWFEADIRPKNFIYIRLDKNSLAFTLQKGPVKEVGVNGCQVETIIQAAQQILRKFDEKVPHEENALAIFHLTKALWHLEMRKKDRESRHVEGTSQI